MQEYDFIYPLLGIIVIIVILLIILEIMIRLKQKRIKEQGERKEMGAIYCERCHKTTYASKCDFCGHDNKKEIYPNRPKQKQYNKTYSNKKKEIPIKEFILPEDSYKKKRDPLMIVIAVALVIIALGVILFYLSIYMKNREEQKAYEIFNKELIKIEKNVEKENIRMKKASEELTKSFNNIQIPRIQTNTVKPKYITKEEIQKRIIKQRNEIAKQKREIAKNNLKMQMNN